MRKQGETKTTETNTKGNKANKITDQNENIT